MRRDYFLCVFLACVCASLFFVCFVPNYFTYSEIVPREFGLFEKIMSAVYAVTVLLAIPVFAAYRKKVWITIGLASYGILALIPEWILPRFQDQIENDEAGVGVVVIDFVLKFIYGMVKAPFAALSDAIGDNKADSLSGWILPSSVLFYVLCQLYRFYRDAYVAEQLDPTSIMDKTAKENIRQPEVGKSPHVPEPEVLGTVISAPVQSAPAPAPAPAAPTSEPKSAPAADPSSEAIPMPAPARESIEAPTSTAIPMPPPKTEPVPEIPVQATAKPATGTAPKSTPKRPIEQKPSGPEVIQMGAPKPSAPPAPEGNSAAAPSPYDDNGAIRL